MTTANPNYQAILSQLIGDMYDITCWASDMIDAGKSLQSMVAFLAGRNPVSLKSDRAFATERANLQKKMAKVLAPARPGSKSRGDWYRCTGPRAPKALQQGWLHPG